MMLVIASNNSVADKVTHVIDQLGDYIPEAILMGSLLLLVLIDLILIRNDHKKAILGVASLVLLSLALGYLFYPFSTMLDVTLFYAVKIVLLLATLGCVLLMMQDELEDVGEQYALVFGMLLGSFFLINSDSLLTFYLSLEVMSISAYILTVLRFSNQSAEAGLKYLLFGATSSAIMLFGISLVYGFSGTLALDLIDVDSMIALVGTLPVMIAFGLMLVGLLFKVAAVPQHIWSPDVYQTASTSVVAYFSIVPKLAGITAFLVVITNSHLPEAWISTALAVIAIATMVVGNFAALWQNNVKRMLAYSSIAHTGFLLIPVIVNSQMAWQSFVFYAIVYLLMNIAAFALVMQLEKETHALKISDYAGLGKSMPFLGVLLLVVLLSLVGLPPTAGFTSKLLMFTAIWESYSNSGDLLMLILLVIGVLNTVVSLFYYLKIPFFMFIRSEGRQEFQLTKKRQLLNYFAALLVFMLLALFFKPDWLMDLIYNINFAI
jgi:NADH-quinone oxidoreductase subunit N